MTKKMYNEPQVDVTIQVEPEQPVMLLSSGTAPEPVESAPIRKDIKVPKF